MSASLGYSIDACYFSPPAITFDQALNSRFVLRDITYHVSSCPVSALKQLVSDTITAQKKGKRRDELEELLNLLSADVDELTRWFVIEELLTLNVTIHFAA